MESTSYTNIVETSIVNALHGESKITEDSQIVGMSGIQNRHFYNNLFGMDNATYLVVGVGDGSALCGAMIGNSSRIFCIDGSVNSLMSMLNKYKGMNTLTEIEGDWRLVDGKTFPMFDVLVYNSGKDDTEQSVYGVLKKFSGFMKDQYVLVVENWNIETVRNGVNGAISELGLLKEYSREIFTPGDEFPTWWNGMFVVNLMK